MCSISINMVVQKKNSHSGTSYKVSCCKEWQHLPENYVKVRNVLDSINTVLVISPYHDLITATVIHMLSAGNYDLVTLEWEYKFGGMEQWRGLLEGCGHRRSWSACAFQLAICVRPFCRQGGEHFFYLFRSCLRSLGSPINPIVVEDNSPSLFAWSPVKILEGG